MTTIACDGKSMAGDTLVTGGGERVGSYQKVRRAKDGRIFGCAGAQTDSIRFARWIDGELDDPKLEDKFEALILCLDGAIHWIGKELEPLEYFAPMTVGCGGPLALGAMLAGKTPEEAVAVACERDLHSGGKITVLHLEPALKQVA